MRELVEHVVSLLSGRSGAGGVWPHAAGRRLPEHVGGVTRGARGLLLAALSRSRPCILALVETDEEIEALLGNLTTLGEDDAVRLAPLDLEAEAPATRQAEAVSERLLLARRIIESRPPRIIPATLRALLEPLPAPAQLAVHRRRLTVGDTLDSEVFLAELLEADIARRARVEIPGEMSMRGGIMDVFAYAEDHPLRIELAGDTIASMRRFHVESQRSLERVEQIDLELIAPEQIARPGPDGLLLDEMLTAAGIEHALVAFEPRALQERARAMAERIDRRQTLDVDPARVLENVLARGEPDVVRATLLPPAQGDHSAIDARVETVQRYTAGIEAGLSALAARAADGERVLIPCRTKAELERLREIVSATGAPGSTQLELVLGEQSEGFRLTPARVTVVPADTLAGRLRPPARRPQRFGGSRSIESVLTLEPGDIVVHVSHGIAKFLGLEKINKQGRVVEHLALEFAESVKLLVGVANADLVHRYVGAGDQTPQLSKLGSSRWATKRSQVAAEVMDMAADLLRLQAARQDRPGISHPPPSHWQMELEAAFPYDETPDQLTEMVVIHEDIGRPRPMDRLLCGDVGYGKTELAMRAAFRVVEGGRQVAILVPTTVLAAQHLRTFRERMAAFPVSIDMLSRFQTAREERRIIADLPAGRVDIVIGTHRLLSKDVQFKDLGMVVIDEEQRFGVKHKEHLKRMRTEVDVLAMTATPIPRTLHMAMIGIRDISNLTTPPRERLSIETRVVEFDEKLVREAIERELARDGQVFVVHNRIHDIQELARSIKLLVPQARIGVGHGQMAEQQLARTMQMFVEGKIDVLVSTTIVESGLDIPNANTIIIDRAENYGLSELHQLRGRVGRYNRRAQCILMVDPDRALSEVGARRLKAIEEFADLGAGFEIALRDLEIRGAGNVLGPQQSGHIAAIGYELYCRLLRVAADGLRQGGGASEAMPAETPVDLGVDCMIPLDYVPDAEERLVLYTRLAQASTAVAEADLLEELGDRFGPPPQTVLALLTTARVKALLGRLGVTALVTDADTDQHRYVLTTPTGQAPAVAQALASEDAFVRHIDARKIMIDLEPPPRNAQAVLEATRRLFLGKQEADPVELAVEGEPGGC